LPLWTRQKASLLPAGAGVILTDPEIIRTRLAAPRRRGGDPLANPEPRKLKNCSPQARG